MRFGSPSSAARPEDALSRVKEAVEVLTGQRGDQLDQAVTYRDLIDGGIATLSGASIIGGNKGVLISSNPDTMSDSPTTPVALSATGAFSSVQLSFDYAYYASHSYTEVWRSSTNSLGSATLIGTTEAKVYTDYLVNTATQYYWVRNVNAVGAQSAFNATGGTAAGASTNPAYLLTLLNGSLSESELITSLNSRINLVDGSGVGSVNARIATETSARTLADGSLFAQYTVKIDANGKVAGFGLASTATAAGVGTSEFAVVADRFSISPPAGVSGVSQIAPFIVQATATTLNGVAVPAGVYMDSAFIRNGSITNAKIGDATIESAKIASLNAGKITTGTLEASRIAIDGLTLDTEYDPGSGTTRLIIKGGGVGTTQISNGAVSTPKLGDGAVTTPKLGDGAVTGSKLGDFAVDVTKFASGIRPIEIVGTLPTTGNVEGRTVYLTADGKLYRWVGSAFIATVPAADIVGTLGTTQIADESLTVAKFASGLRPVEVVGALPTTGNVDGRMVFLTTDKKLYRYSTTAGAFVKSVDGADITANSIVAGSIQAGAIGADQLAANSVRTDKLLVTGRGAALNADPEFSDASAWNGSGVVVTVTDAPSGNTALVNTASLQRDITSTGFIPIERTKRYRVEAWVRQHAGTGGGMYLGVAFFDSTKTLIDSSVSNPAGWSNGTYSYFGRVGQTVTSTFTRYLTTFGPGEVGAFPTNARYVQLVALLNFGSTAGVQHAVTGFRLMEKADADLIVDGSVVASKISSGAVTTDKMTANSINGDRVLANSLAASKIVANSITAGQVQAGAIGATELAAKSISAEKIRIGAFDNLIANGNFSTGDMSDMRIWSGTYTVVGRGAAGVPSGAASTDVAKGVENGSAGTSFFTGAKSYLDAGSFAYAVQCKPGEVFYISADVAAQSGTTGNFSLIAWHYVAGVGATSLDYTGVGSSVVLTSAWQTVAGRFTVPANVIGFWLYLYHYGVSAAGTTFTSNLRVIRAATGELVVDGAITAAKLEADLVLASTLKTAASGFRTEISNAGSYPIWYGSGTKNDANAYFYLKTDGSAYFRGTVGVGSKLEIFTVTVAAISGSASGAAGTGNVTSSAASVTLTNGTASYTYDWQHVGQILGEIPTISSSTAAAPTFTRNAVDANEPSTSIWRCTVTDSKGNVSSSQAYVRLIWVDTR